MKIWRVRGGESMNIERELEGDYLFIIGIRVYLYMYI